MFHLKVDAGLLLVGFEVDSTAFVKILAKIDLKCRTKIYSLT
jgi:hypothetical protein